MAFPQRLLDYIISKKALSDFPSYSVETRLYGYDNGRKTLLTALLVVYYKENDEEKHHTDIICFTDENEIPYTIEELDAYLNILKIGKEMEPLPLENLAQLIDNKDPEIDGLWQAYYEVVPEELIMELEGTHNVTSIERIPEPIFPAPEPEEIKPKKGRKTEVVAEEPKEEIPENQAESTETTEEVTEETSVTDTPSEEPKSEE